MQSYAYGTSWEIYGVQLDGVTLSSYTASGTIGTSNSFNLTFYTLNASANNTSYGSLSPTNLIVWANETYSVNSNVLTVSDGRKITASATSATGYTTSFSSWSSTSGKITGKTSVTANFTRNANKYKVTLDSQSATSAGTTAYWYYYDTQTYYSNEAATTTLSFTKPTRTGYTFKGYYTGTNGTGTQYINASGTQVNSVYQTATDRTLYAYWIDDIAPTITVSPTSGVAARTRSITITAADSGGGLSTSNSYQYALSTSSTSITGSWTNYTSGTAFTAGTNLTGTYYLFVKRVSDSSSNVSTSNGTDVTISNVVYHRYGTYVFDNTGPTTSNIKVTTTGGTYVNTSNQTITIVATFNENVYGTTSKGAITGTTAPTLKLKFGSGTERTASFSGTSNATITYTYKIQSTDEGTLAITSYSGGTVYDQVGNVGTVSTLTNTGNTITVVVPVALASKVSVGDYVNYNATNSYSYTSVKGTGPSHGNGYGSQTFTSKSSIKWRVLSKNTSTGEVVLISEAPIQTDAGANYCLNGAIGYLYGEEELNRVCSIYGHGTGANTSKSFTCQTGDEIEGYSTVTLTGSGARSINVDDINSICGVTPSTALDSEYGTKPYTHTIFYPTKTTTEGYSKSAASRSATYTYYTYKGSSYLTSTEEPYKMLFRNYVNTGYIDYWLSSSYAIYDESTGYFGLRVVYYDGNVRGHGLGKGFGSYFQVNPVGSYAVRPVVYLKSSIKTTGQNSDGAWNIME